MCFLRDSFLFGCVGGNVSHLWQQKGEGSVINNLVFQNSPMHGNLGLLTTRVQPFVQAGEWNTGPHINFSITFFLNEVPLMDGYICWTILPQVQRGTMFASKIALRHRKDSSKMLGYVPYVVLLESSAGDMLPPLQRGIPSIHSPHSIHQTYVHRVPGLIKVQIQH